ncbi:MULTISPECIES: 3-oxoacid CoA-transferase subunit B [Cytobacillus]|nr:3-oxoacid CoA-transferase subunit B [Cytobacillus oceanisediminis]MBY0156465.1 3-oxoacid CoA-transferase subunit B [Cytobacillus firmus]MCM3392285.1 3-oxoacid CoA-transferase subunit B [Cytobacillus oceanisediminis]MCM3530669.1 3-oxoacid CoA-transferase subunit B [Cytobacillus oceanisediminis]USK41988.1 3-oxoacid CoA-transferase subunit B [Cytobacillus oceanisediminis]
MSVAGKKLDTDKVRIAKRIAMELPEGSVVNLGVGIPTLIQNYLRPESKVYLQSENGLLGMGPTPPKEEIDMDLISASKHPISLGIGASIFSSSDSFVMIRGGHIDVAVLGALQVNGSGEIANWAVPGQDILGVGGAMDLVASAKKIIVAITHLTKDHLPKIVNTLTYPTSGIRKAEMIVTEKAVFKVNNGELYLEELSENSTIDEIRRMTDAAFIISENLKKMPV